MKRNDVLIIAGLILVALALYLPVFFADYFYTDEIVQLWNYKKGTDFNMFAIQGRVFTDILFRWLFEKAHTIDDIRFIRLFSLGGWLLAIPIWYYIIRKVFVKENLPPLLAGFVVLYLICMPVFTLSIQWAACLELFLANTAGLISGYCLYTAIRFEQDRMRITTTGFLLAILSGLLALFTYQNGFGCFLLPFFVHLLMQPGKWKKVITGIAGYLFICLIYFILFKYYLKLNHIGPSTRAEVHINVLNKLLYFFGKTLPGSYHFTWLVNEKSVGGRIIYILLFGLTLLAYNTRLRGRAFSERAKQILFIVILLLFVYLPSLIVKENFSSNRTLLALNMSVFLFVLVALLKYLKTTRHIRLAVAIFSLLFIGNAYYNLHVEFLRPVQKEYAQVRQAIESKYKTGMDTVFFIRPLENTFEKKYGIARSWDEFGVPSTFFEWVPEFMVKQIVFEKTGDREKAGKLVVRNWLGKSGEQPSPRVVFIDVEEILK